MDKYKLFLFMILITIFVGSIFGYVLGFSNEISFILFFLAVKCLNDVFWFEDTVATRNYILLLIVFLVLTFSLVAFIEFSPYSFYLQISELELFILMTCIGVIYSFSRLVTEKLLSNFKNDILYLAIIALLIVSIHLFIDMKSIKITSYLKFTQATDNVSVLIEEGANKEEIHRSLIDLDNSYSHNIARFHRMTYSNDTFFDEVEDYIHERDDINWDLLNQYMASIDRKIGEFIRSEKGVVNDKEMNQFIEGLREEFYELFPNGEPQN